MRYKCANCGFVFDWEPHSSIETEPNCPHCNSNAVDLLPPSLQPQFKSLGKETK